MVDLSDIYKLSPITWETVKQFHDAPVKRICFSTAHAKALKRVDGRDYIAVFKIPFCETIEAVFSTQTGLRLYENKKFPGWHRLISQEEEYLKIQDWIRTQGCRVFIRDGLSSSRAMSQYFRARN